MDIYCIGDIRVVGRCLEVIGDKNVFFMKVLIEIN